MTSDFDAPGGPASSMPPPPPGSGQVPPPPPPPPPAPETAVPPPPPSAPAPPSSPPAPPSSPPAPASPPTPPRDDESGGAGVPDDLADILSRLDDEPVAATDHGAMDGATASSSAIARSSGAANRLTDPRDLERPSTASQIVIESEGGLDFDPTFASFGKRALEFVVDTIVLGLALIPGLVIAAVAGSLWFVGLVVAVIGFALYIVVGARSIAASGKSVGNRVAGTRIVDGINGADIDVGRAALRLLVRHLISTILLIGFLVAFTDGQRRTFHDRLARTVVIGREREVWTSGDA